MSKVIWFSIVSSVLVFGVVLDVVLKEKNKSLFSSFDFNLVSDPMAIAIFGAALAALVASYVVPSLMIANLEEAKKNPLFPQLVGLTLAESIAIFGLILSILQERAEPFLVLAALSLVRILTLFPTGEDEQKRDTK